MALDTRKGPVLSEAPHNSDANSCGHSNRNVLRKSLAKWAATASVPESGCEKEDIVRLGSKRDRYVAYSTWCCRLVTRLTAKRPMISLHKKNTLDGRSHPAPATSCCRELAAATL